MRPMNVNDGGAAPEPGVVRRERHRARRRGAVPAGEGAIRTGDGRSGATE